MTAVQGLSARDVSRLAASYRRASGTFADRIWFQLLNGRFARYQPPIVEFVAAARDLAPSSASMVESSLDDAIERARADPDRSRVWPRAPLTASRLVVMIWTPLILLGAGVLLLSIVPWLAVLSFVAIPVSLAAVVAMARLSPTSSARSALQAAALGALIEHDLEPILRARLPATCPDVLLQPWREALEGRPRPRQTILDRLATWLFVGGTISIVILVSGLMVASVASGQRIVTPDANWASALWISVGALVGGFALVALPRVLRHGRAR